MAFGKIKKTFRLHERNAHNTAVAQFRLQEVLRRETGTAMMMTPKGDGKSYIGEEANSGLVFTVLSVI